MGMRIETLRPLYCEEVPAHKEEGTLYISKKYEVAIHLCPCGCGNQAVTPLDEPKGWKLTEEHPTPNTVAVTLSPSLLNYGCGAHYFIRANKVVWA